MTRIYDAMRKREEEAGEIPAGPQASLANVDGALFPAEVASTAAGQPSTDLVGNLDIAPTIAEPRAPVANARSKAETQRRLTTDPPVTTPPELKKGTFERIDVRYE